MSRIPTHTVEDAPAESRPLLQNLIQSSPTGRLLNQHHEFRCHGNWEENCPLRRGRKRGLKQVYAATRQSRLGAAHEPESE